jgi:beta-lactamase superfamily II metal-dependent hydrolase
LVLKRYKAKGCRVLETAHNGAVSMQTDGQALMAMPTITDKKAFLDKHQNY